MPMLYDNLFKPLLFQADPEDAHHMIMNLGKKVNQSPLFSQSLKAIYSFQSDKLRQNLLNLDFPNPVGLAAGFDKNGKLPQLMQALGFGFVEVGSITAQPSSGNPKPRLFRLPDDDSLINRLGLNNDGAQTICRRLEHQNISIPLGVNIAKTNDPALTGDRATEDYVISYTQANRIADYITINISCPNTEDGKSFEHPAIFRELMEALPLHRDARVVPTLVKISPDSSDQMIEDIIEISEEFGIDGYVATNTTSTRPDHLSTSRDRIQEIGRGGLSGKVLFEQSNRVIRLMREILGPHKLIIGVGGVHSVESAIAKLKAGADLLQLYTGLVYEGPGLAGKINEGIAKYMKQQGIESIENIRKMEA